MGQHRGRESVVHVASCRGPGVFACDQRQATSQWLESVSRMQDSCSHLVNAQIHQQRHGLKRERNIVVAVLTQETERRRETRRVGRDEEHLAAELVGFIVECRVVGDERTVFPGCARQREFVAAVVLEGSVPVKVVGSQ